MSSSNKPNKNRKELGHRTYEATDGLEDFLLALEKYFYARAKVQCKHDFQKNCTDLVIDLYHNFGIAECLRYFNNGDWGNHSFTEESHSNISASLEKALESLNKKSAYPMDILELSFHFKDTSIIVARLSKNSIPHYASKILTAICEHFVYLTKGLTEMPYEIFVPVFEDNSIPENPPEINSPCGYLDYWGLYFDHGPKHEALIYALNKKKFFEDSIFLFE